jgi:hypothetical protein
MAEPPGPRRSAGVSGPWACDAKQWQDSRGVAGVAAQRGGGVAVAVQAQDGNGEVAQAGHGAWGGAGADLAGVLGEGGVAEVVQRLDAPVPADPVGQAGGVGLGAAVRLVTAYTVTVRQRRPASGRVRRVIRRAWVAYGKSRPWPSLQPAEVGFQS